MRTKTARGSGFGRGILFVLRHVASLLVDVLIMHRKTDKRKAGR